MTLLHYDVVHIAVFNNRLVLYLETAQNVVNENKVQNRSKSGKRREFLRNWNEPKTQQ